MPPLSSLFYLAFLMSGTMNDPREYQQPESDDALEFWMWCEEQSELHADDDDDESIEIELIPEEEPPF